MPRKPKKEPLTLTHISKDAHELIKTLESDAMAVEAATYYAVRNSAYGKLSVTRKSLYEYIARLEHSCGVPPTNSIEVLR